MWWGVGCSVFLFLFLRQQLQQKMSFLFTLGVSSPETAQRQRKEGNDFQLWGGGKHYLVAQGPVLTSFGRFYNYFSEELYASLKKYLTSGRIRSEKKKGVCVYQ